jgi:hypothetical protein
MDHGDAFQRAIARSPRSTHQARKSADHGSQQMIDNAQESVGFRPPDATASRQSPTESRSDVADFQKIPLHDWPALRPFPDFRRRSRGLISYRDNSKLPLHLRRQTSLETIDSVGTTTTAKPRDDLRKDSADIDASSRASFTLEDDPSATSTSTALTSRPVSILSSEESSEHSATRQSGGKDFTSQENNSFKSLLKRITSHKSEEAPPLPDRLVIQRAVSIDHISQQSNTSNRGTDPPARSLNRAHPPETNQSRSDSSSSQWSASSFDISNLTEEQIKKCQKKGINPALWAEMKAAKKGKWTSPIAGNTFL